MTNAGMRKGSIFEGFQVGPVLAGILTATGIEMLIRALSWPFASVIAGAINYMIRVGRFEIVGPGPVYVSSLLLAANALTAIVILLCAFRLGAWLTSNSA
jgi:hypothetical protein